MQSLQRFLERNLKLKINQEKSRVASTNQTVILGFTFSGTRISSDERSRGKALDEVSAAIPGDAVAGNYCTHGRRYAVP